MTPILSFNHLSVRVGSHLALNHLDGSIPEKSFLAIMGPNGAGKSVLIKTILGLLDPEEGSISLWGKPVHQISPSWIGYVPQIKTLDRSFPALSIELVVSGLICRWPASISKEEEIKAMQAMEKVGALNLADRPLNKLSGGELQRVYLARSLVRRPRLVILDEPATGIDAVGESDMYELLENYRRETGATIVMVTHDMEVAWHHATQVLIINQKQIGFGSPKECLTEEVLGRAFGHWQHTHEIGKGVHRHD